MLVFKDPEGPIEVGVGQSFAIQVQSNHTTDYVWTTDFDPRKLSCLDHDRGEASRHANGSGSEERFSFRTNEPGETRVRMVCKREWESEVREVRVFTVRVNN